MGRLGVYGIFVQGLHASRHQVAQVDPLSPVLQVGGVAGGSALTYTITGEAQPRTRLFDGGLEALSAAGGVVLRVERNLATGRAQIVLDNNGISANVLIRDGALANSVLLEEGQITLGAAGAVRGIMDVDEVRFLNAAGARVAQYAFDHLEIGAQTMVPTTGDIRLQNGAVITWRNFANSANLSAINVDANDRLLLGSATVPVAPFSNGVTTLGVAGVTHWGALHSVFASLGTTAQNPALTGALRLPNANTLSARNAANGADVALIQLNAADQVQLPNANVVPPADNQGQLGTAARRWNDVRCVSLTQGDLNWENGYKMVEAEHLGLGQGIALVRPNGEVAHVWR